MGKAAPQLQPVAKIPGTCLIQSARIFSRSKLYLLLEGGWRSEDPIYHPFLRQIFDFKTGKLEPFVPPIGCKPFGTLVSAYGKLYYLATPANCPFFPEQSFECYDPAKDSWEELPNFPFFHEDWFYINGIRHRIGVAVCYGCIVFSMADFTGKFRVYAFHLSRSEWCRVKAHEPFEGRAVVVGNTIYALRASCQGYSQVMEFYFTMDEGDGGCIACSLSRPSAMHDIEFVPPPYPFDDLVSQYLVHLGNRDFCYVITGPKLDFESNQHLCVTTFQIVAGEEGSSKINTLHLAAYVLDMEQFEEIKINFCCTPEHDDFEPEGKQPKQEEETKCKGNAAIHREPVSRPTQASNVQKTARPVRNASTRKGLANIRPVRNASIRKGHASTGGFARQAVVTPAEGASQPQSVITSTQPKMKTAANRARVWKP